MSTKPHTPSVDEMRAAAESDNPYGSMEPDEFDRGVAKIRASALREFANELEANLTITSGSDDALTIGVLRERADEIEEEA